LGAIARASIAHIPTVVGNERGASALSGVVEGHALSAAKISGRQTFGTVRLVGTVALFTKGVANLTSATRLEVALATG
jgi:hypothetical protein